MVFEVGEFPRIEEDTPAGLAGFVTDVWLGLIMAVLKVTVPVGADAGLYFVESVTDSRVSGIE